MTDKNKVLFTFKKSYHISHSRDYFCCVGSSVNLYNINSGDFISNFKDIKHPNYSKFIHDNNLIVKSSYGDYYIYDLDLMECVKIIPPPPKVKGSITDFQITSDGKYIIDFSYVFPIHQLMVIDVETGAYSFFDIGFCRAGFVFSTEIDSIFYVVTVCAETVDAPNVSFQVYYELSYMSGKFELKKLFCDGCSKVANVDYGSNKFAFSDYSNKIEFFDVRNRLVDELQYNKNGILYDLKISKSGRYIALAESQNIYIYGIENKECICNYEVENGCFVDFLDDEKLLIGTWKKGYCLLI